MSPTEEMRFFSVIGVKKINVSRVPIFGSLVELGEKRYMITGLCSQNKPQVVPLQVTNVQTRLRCCLRQSQRW